MYRYDEYDRTLVNERVEEFRDQVARRISGELTEEEFLPLRLQNGLYLQKHAYMMRVAIPYGALSSDQMRGLAAIANKFDRGYGHFTTRQNIQFNWIELADTPDILAHLASIDMHAIQTSGNCVRNVTTEAYAGVAPDEEYDPRIFAEIIRQWATVNPEFLFLPRKFKIAVSSSQEDRAAVRMHDIGLYLYRDEEETLRFQVMVGGGLGRTPFLNQLVKDNLHWSEVLSYIEAVLRVFNRYGRRDNKYKARIKILVNSLGISAFREEAEAEWQQIRGSFSTLTEDELSRVASQFLSPLYKALDDTDLQYGHHLTSNSEFASWASRSVKPHKVKGYASVAISTKFPTNTPGDLTAEQIHRIADLADLYGFGVIRVAHEQNLVLPDIPKQDLFSVWTSLCEVGLALPNVGLVSDMIVCPGASYCNLATAHSFPVARKVAEAYSLAEQLDVGDISINLSGCINACAHHHIGNIGILGLNKSGKDYYQITIGGAQGKDSQIGKVIGPAVSEEVLPGVVKNITNAYLSNRNDHETFHETFLRIGLEPFKLAAYGPAGT
jgi:sulfite reductase (NADPH) hemoprotein beta-component